MHKGKTKKKMFVIVFWSESWSSRHANIPESVSLFDQIIVFQWLQWYGKTIPLYKEKFHTLSKKIGSFNGDCKPQQRSLLINLEGFSYIVQSRLKIEKVLIFQYLLNYSFNEFASAHLEIKEHFIISILNIDNIYVFGRELHLFWVLMSLVLCKI